MPISPSTSTCADRSTAAAPRAIASSVSASVIAGPAVKSCVGRSRSSATTDRSAPLARQSWLIAAPPCSKFATICAVTSCGKGFTPCAQMPWLPAKITACALAIRGRSVASHSAMKIARSSSRPKDPGGFVRLFCRSRAACAAAASAFGRSARRSRRASKEAAGNRSDIISPSVGGRTRPG